MEMNFDQAALISDYTPVLVLYPEIGSTPESGIRKENPDFPYESPLEFDYHPRDIKIVLEHAVLHQRFRWGRAIPVGWAKLLDRMEGKGYEKNLDLLPGVDPTSRASFWKNYADIPQRDQRFPRKCYAHLKQGKGSQSNRVVAQYWYPYFYNDFWNTHEMDWEVVMIVFRLTDTGLKPTVCAYSAHLGGHWLPWADVAISAKEPALLEERNGTHPVVYVASGSHANYFAGPAMYVTAPPLVAMAANLIKEDRPLIDYTPSWEDGSPQLIPAEVIPQPDNRGIWDGDWRWLNQKERWGSPGKWLDFEFGDSGPKGPPQAGDRWDFPFRWIDTSYTQAPSAVPTSLDP